MTEKNGPDVPKGSRKRGISRREFVKVIVSLGVLGTAASFLALLKSLLPSPGGSQTEGELDNTFRYGPEQGAWYSDKSGSEVKVEDFDQVGKGAGVIWRGNIPAILIRVDETKLQGTTATNGLVAYASTCTHLCCIATWKIDRPNENVLFCRCHDGVFDPYNIVNDRMPNGIEYLGAKVLSGPPPRAVPIIPVQIKDGKVSGNLPNPDLLAYCE